MERKVRKIETGQGECENPRVARLRTKILGVCAWPYFYATLVQKKMMRYHARKRCAVCGRPGQVP